MSDTQDTGPQTIDQLLDAKFAEPEGPTEELEESTTEEVEAEAEAETVEAEAEEVDAEEDQTAEPEEAQILTLEEYGEILIQKPDGSKATLAELSKGDLRQSDYTRKTQELSQERSLFESEKETFTQQIAQKMQQLDEQLAGTGEPEPDWIEIARNDPLGFPEQKELWNQKQRQQAAAKARLDQQQEATKADFSRKTATVAVERMPEWSDPKVFESTAEARHKAAMDAGFTEQEIGAAVDYRLAILLEKASRYDALKGKTADVLDRKVAKAPKVLKPGSAKTKQDQQVVDRAAVKRKLSRPHTIEERLKALGM